MSDNSKCEKLLSYLGADLYDEYIKHTGHDWIDSATEFEFTLPHVKDIVLGMGYYKEALPNPAYTSGLPPIITEYRFVDYRYGDRYFKIAANKPINKVMVVPWEWETHNVEPID